jgi:hypothetical protein
MRICSAENICDKGLLPSFCAHIGRVGVVAPRVIRIQAPVGVDHFEGVRGFLNI